MNVRNQTLEKGMIVPMTFDYVFTGILNNEKNIRILEEFLSGYLDIELESIRGKVKLAPRELDIKNKKQKNVQIDLLVDMDGEKINIELSNQSSRGVKERNIVYACNIHSGQLKYGDTNYTRIEKTIQIQLNNYRCNEKNIKETYYLRNENGKIMTEKLQIDIVDMVKGREGCYTSREERIAAWCKVFTAKTLKELIEAIGGTEMEKDSQEKLVEEVEKYSRDEEVIGLYMKLSKEELERNTYIEEAKEDARKEGLEEGLKEGLEKGLEQGIEQGIEQGLKKGREEARMMIEEAKEESRKARNNEAKEIARKFKESGIDINLISKNTGLSIEEIETL